MDRGWAWHRSEKLQDSLCRVPPRPSVYVVASYAFTEGDSWIESQLYCYHMVSSLRAASALAAAGCDSCLPEVLRLMPYQGKLCTPVDCGCDMLVPCNSYGLTSSMQCRAQRILTGMWLSGIQPVKAMAAGKGLPP